MLPDLETFFADVEAHTGDTRFTDPSYLAAKWVVWLAAMFAKPYDWSKQSEKDAYREHLDATGCSLAFISVGVLHSEPSDIQHRYFVDCSNLDGDGRPTVTHEETNVYTPDCELIRADLSREKQTPDADPGRPDIMIGS
jgi:hypothetical protein